MNNIVAPIAVDVALEIVLAADCMDKSDLDFVIERDKLNRKELRRQSEQYIVGIINHEITPFVTSQLDYWYGK